LLKFEKCKKFDPFVIFEILSGF